jgi:hypothetical protein
MRILAQRIGKQQVLLGAGHRDVQQTARLLVFALAYRFLILRSIPVGEQLSIGGISPFGPEAALRRIGEGRDAGAHLGLHPGYENDGELESFRSVGGDDAHGVERFVERRVGLAGILVANQFNLMHEFCEGQAARGVARESEKLLDVGRGGGAGRPGVTAIGHGLGQQPVDRQIVNGCAPACEVGTKTLPAFGIQRVMQVDIAIERRAQIVTGDAQAHQRLVGQAGKG